MASVITTSAPGSLMLFGEHAVLHGRLALVCAVGQRIKVTLSPRTDTEINIHSALGEFHTDLRRIETAPDFRFVLGAIKKSAERIPGGFDLNIASEFSHNIGFGSSAAVTVAATAALAQWTCGDVDNGELFKSSRETIRSVQGLGSGTDVAASVYGGLLLYRADPLEIEQLSYTHPLCAVYSGGKTPTPEVVDYVEKRRVNAPTIYAEIFEAMEQCSMDAADAATMQDWKTFGDMMNIAHGLMDAMGVNTARLSEIVYALRGDPGILGSKISGSGLGDCAIGLGRVARHDFPMPVIPVDMSHEGIIVEKN